MAATDPETWGPSLLAILAEHHGLAGSRREMRRLFDTAGGGLTLASLVQVAGAFGFETQAGRLPSYDDLEQLDVLPAVVHLRRKVPERMLALGADGAFEDVGREGRFAVVHQVDGTAVELEDPEAGRLRMPRAEFEAAWQGIVLCVAPSPEQEAQRESPRRSRAGLADRLARVPPLLASLLVCGLTFALGAGLARLADEGAVFAVAGAVTAALAASVWALRTTARCAACASAAKEIGLPLAPLGILAYAGILAALYLTGLVPVTAAAILAAAGAHLALLAHLAAARVACHACTATAWAAWAASGIVVGMQGAGGSMAALPAAALLAGLAVRIATRRTERLHSAKLAAVREVLAGEAGPTPGSLRLVVYKRDTCPKCHLLEKEILPPLEQMLGGRLTVERRPAGARIPAPSLFFLGGARRVAIVGLPDADDLRQALAGG